MGFFSSFLGSITSGLSGSSNSTQKKKKNALAEKNEKAYNEAKKAFDHFFDDEKLVEVEVDSKQDD